MAYRLSSDQVVHDRGQAGEARRRSKIGGDALTDLTVVRAIQHVEDRRAQRGASGTRTQSTFLKTILLGFPPKCIQ